MIRKCKNNEQKLVPIFVFKHELSNNSFIKIIYDSLGVLCNYLAKTKEGASKIVCIIFSSKSKVEKQCFVFCQPPKVLLSVWVISYILI